MQGIADLVLVYDDHAEILDYKTDRSRDAAFYIKEYAAQLQLYRRAFAQRLAVPVTKLTIYSFTLGEEIDIPLQATQKFVNSLDVNPQLWYYSNTSFAGLFLCPFSRAACKREGGLLTDNGGAEQ